MSNHSSERNRPMPMICGYCQSHHVRLVRNAKRALIQCQNCGKRLFAYYADPDRWKAVDIPPSDGDRFLKREVEQAMLDQATEPARALYVFLRRYIKKYGYAPTLREMQDGLGWDSVNSVRHYLTQLEKVGLIERDYGAARGIRLMVVA